MELVLLALGSCTGVDVISILKKKRQQVTGYSIEVTGEQGPPHQRTFTVAALVGGETLGTGRGHSKKQAEQEAARVAVEALEG